ncbi:MAG: RDD family protein [Solirubrobacterales bacterium]|nr:RDD family protein [Solirubrobacterales bacterium]
MTESEDAESETIESPDSGTDRSLAGRLVAGGAGRAQRVASATGLGQTLETAIEEAIVRAVESEATERAVGRILNGPVVEQAVEQALRSPAVEQAILDVVDSDLTDRVWARVLDSEETQKLIEHIAGSPEIRNAIAAHGIGLVDQIGGGVASVSRLVDSLVERVAWRLTFRKPRTDPTDRVGVVTRALALAIDALIVNIGLVSATAIFGILTSFLGLNIDPDSRSTAVVGATTWFGLASVYLFTFWALSGQTPGMRFLNIEIKPGNGLGGRPAFRRLVGFWLCVLPFCLGFLGVLLSRDRRGFHDRLGRTEVLYEPVETFENPSPPAIGESTPEAEAPDPPGG